MIKRKLSLILTLFSLTLACSAFAFPKGFYLGGSLGYTNENLEDFSTKRVEEHGYNSFTLKGKNTSDPDFSVFAGYNINRYVGIELSYTHLPDPKYVWHEIQYEDGIQREEHTGTAKMEFYEITFMTKGYMPIKPDRLSLYGGLGLSRVYEKISLSESKNVVSEYLYRPKIEIGIKYDINPHLSLNAHASRIFKKGSVKKLYEAEGEKANRYSPNIDFYGISVIYNI